MHLKFLARGTGSAAAAAAYLLAKRDAAGTERAAVEVLRGDPLEVARVADGLPFKYLYTSGVLAWSLEDAPTRAEIERVLDEFEETAWAGLDLPVPQISLAGLVNHPNSSRSSKAKAMATSWV